MLIYFVARQLLASELFGILAAVLLALTPAHYIHARYGMDYLYPVPFILGWLLCLVRYRERRRPWLLILGTSILGIGFYSYIASIVTMPLYFLVTCLILYMDREDRRAYVFAACGFVPWLIPFVAWLAGHPHAFDATVAKYALYDAHQLDARAGVSVALQLRERQRTRVAILELLQPGVPAVRQRHQDAVFHQPRRRLSVLVRGAAAAWYLRRG